MNYIVNNYTMFDSLIAALKSQLTMNLYYSDKLDFLEVKRKQWAVYQK